jgi:hypothetical protein
LLAVERTASPRIPPAGKTAYNRNMHPRKPKRPCIEPREAADGDPASGDDEPGAISLQGLLLRLISRRQRLT